MTTSVSRPDRTDWIASSWPGRSSEKPNVSCATRSIRDSSARRPRVTGMDQPWSERKLHFVGIGGAGMSGLAVVAHALGASISGSDRAPSWPNWAYEATGYTPQVGHDAANVPAGATVVYSSAIGPENPERTTGAP